MYKLLLLDDEEIVLKGIQKVYDLPGYGFQVVGTFSNPLKALEQLETLKPDLIITDVKMPQMDGLEFSGKVKKWNPGVEVVILTGYDDFSYAQAAVKIGVSDYLLKPIKKDDFIAMLKHMYQKIEEKHTKENQFQLLQELLQNSYTELKNRFFLALAENDQFDEGLFGMLEKHGQPGFSQQDFMLIKLDTDQISISGDYMSEIGKMTQEVDAILSSYGNVLDFCSDESLFFVLYDFAEEQYEDVTIMVKSFIESRLVEGMELAVGFSYIHHGIRELFQARNDCVRQIFMNDVNIDETSDANPVHRKEINVTIPYTEIENLFHAISIHDEQSIRETIERIYVLPGNNVRVLYREYVVSISFLILLRIYQMQSKYEADHDIVKQEWLDLKNLRREFPTMDDQKKLIEQVSMEMALLISEQKVAAPSKMIREALEYINHHFGDNISLQEVADNINISKNYLCDLFKKEIGVTFINYVTNLRIEKAKEYLTNTDMKMYEVSSAVGYNDYAYFSQIFKKHTGVTLSAYRKNI